MTKADIMLQREGVHLFEVGGRDNIFFKRDCASSMEEGVMQVQSQVAFLLDVTGSMKSIIDATKKVCISLVYD